MNTGLLAKHIATFKEKTLESPEKFAADAAERAEMVKFYQSFSADRIGSMDAEDVYSYLSPLWAMRIWGNKHYVVDKIISDNGLDVFRKSLADLVCGDSSIDERWNRFRKRIKGMGPAMISEVLCKSHPNEFAIWNRKALVGLRYLGIEGLPRYDYQVTGQFYSDICQTEQAIATALSEAGLEDISLLAVDYFIWDELQIEVDGSPPPKDGSDVVAPPEQSEFVHNEVRDKLRDIGQWLGFDAKIEQKVADGAKVDTIWESTIGNMGRVIYVFEVQTAGSIDSLILNLLKSLNNPAVQGVVAVSDSKQLEKITKHANAVTPLSKQLRYWDYEQVLQIHQSLEFVNASINELGLVPESFY